MKIIHFHVIYSGQPVAVELTRHFLPFFVCKIIISVTELRSRITYIHVHVVVHCM